MQLTTITMDNTLNKTDIELTQIEVGIAGILIYLMFMQYNFVFI